MRSGRSLGRLQLYPEVLESTSNSGLVLGGRSMNNASEVTYQTVGSWNHIHHNLANLDLGLMSSSAVASYVSLTEMTLLRLLALILGVVFAACPARLRISGCSRFRV